MILSVSAQTLNYFVDATTTLAAVTGVLDKRQLSVGWSQNVVLVQVNRRIKLVESHIRERTISTVQLAVVTNAVATLPKPSFFFGWSSPREPTKTHSAPHFRD